MDKGNDKEVLVSTSTDGRVVKWSIKKGLDSQDLMLLKREPNQARNETKKGDGQISRYASALTLDFSKRDSNIYLAGTEDGLIHRCRYVLLFACLNCLPSTNTRCSQSYNEQYLNTYVGHTGPVNRIRWCPYADNVFISCSADWTIKVWKEEHEKPQVCSSTVFGPQLFFALNCLPSTVLCPQLFALN